jgi:hypothetical protein
MKTYRLGALTVTGICLVLALNTAIAQTRLYKHTDDNGRVTYTDQPEKTDEKTLPIANTARNGNNPGKANAKSAGKADSEEKGKAGGQRKGGRQKKSKGDAEKQENN